MNSVLNTIISICFSFVVSGQWGTPTVSAAAVIGMMAGVMAGIIESIGDYYACARLAGAPSVPKHAVSRAILIEGFCCMLAGAFGSGAAVTSYSENIGAIGITKVLIQRNASLSLLLYHARRWQSSVNIVFLEYLSEMKH